MNVVKHTQAKSKADVLQQRDSIVTADAEGLMLRRPKSKYTGNRTKDLLKVRAWFADFTWWHTSCNVYIHVVGLLEIA